jgi:hypothetical protein
LVSHEVIVNLIKATKTAQGLRVEAEIDHTIYPAGQKVSDEQMAQINLTKESFHGEAMADALRAAIRSTRFRLTGPVRSDKNSRRA